MKKILGLTAAVLAVSFLMIGCSKPDEGDGGTPATTTGKQSSDAPKSTDVKTDDAAGTTGATGTTATTPPATGTTAGK